MSPACHLCVTCVSACRGLGRGKDRSSSFSVGNNGSFGQELPMCLLAGPYCQMDCSGTGRYRSRRQTVVPWMCFQHSESCVEVLAHSSQTRVHGVKDPLETRTPGHSHPSVTNHTRAVGAQWLINLEASAEGVQPWPLGADSLTHSKTENLTRAKTTASSDVPNPLGTLTKEQCLGGCGKLP